jgi:hypothetical protein
MPVIKIRRGTTQQWASSNRVLQLGELGLDTTELKNHFSQALSKQDIEAIEQESMLLNKELDKIINPTKTIKCIDVCCQDKTPNSISVLTS